MAVERPSRPSAHLSASRPGSPATAADRRSGCVVAALGVSLGAVLITGLALLVMVSLGPVGLAAIGLTAGVFLVVAGQYFLWGWWLGPAIRRRAQQQNDAPPSDQTDWPRPPT
jgi:hypothetical protein